MMKKKSKGDGGERNKNKKRGRERERSEQGGRRSSAIVAPVQNARAQAKMWVTLYSLYRVHTMYIRWWWWLLPWWLLWWWRRQEYKRGEQAIYFLVDSIRSVGLSGDDSRSRPIERKVASSMEGKSSLWPILCTRNTPPIQSIHTNELNLEKYNTGKKKEVVRHILNAGPEASVQQQPLFLVFRVKEKGKNIFFVFQKNESDEQRRKNLGRLNVS